MTYVILAMLEARPGMEMEVQRMLSEIRALVESEPKTRTWYAFKLGPTRFGIFDTFDDEEGRAAHLTGAVAQKIFSRSKEFFSGPPEIEISDVLAFHHK